MTTKDVKDTLGAAAFILGVAIDIGGINITGVSASHLRVRVFTDSAESRDALANALGFSDTLHSTRFGPKVRKGMADRVMIYGRDL
jgi:hypothetical protein